MQAPTIVTLVTWQITNKICIKSFSIITSKSSNK